MSNAENTSDSGSTVLAKLPLLRCGIVMPISSCDGCSEQHWAEVKSIIMDAADIAGFSPELVSEADDVGLIQKRIIQNLYENPIVVCDVSGKNANVMFELGIRLAFDKPTIIIKDDKTSYSFDTASIEHLQYPRDLRYSAIVEFKENLANKIKGTHARATNDTNYTTFLKNFGDFRVSKLKTTEVSRDDFLTLQFQELRDFIERALRNRSDSRSETRDQLSANFGNMVAPDRIVERIRKQARNIRSQVGPNVSFSELVKLVTEASYNSNAESVPFDPDTFTMIVARVLSERDS